MVCRIKHKKNKQSLIFCFRVRSIMTSGCVCVWKTENKLFYVFFLGLFEWGSTPGSFGGLPLFFGTTMGCSSSSDSDSSIRRPAVLGVSIDWRNSADFFCFFNLDIQMEVKKALNYGRLSHMVGSLCPFRYSIAYSIAWQSSYFAKNPWGPIQISPWWGYQYLMLCLC